MRRYAVTRALGIGLTSVLVLGGAASVVPEMVRSTTVTDLGWPEGVGTVRISLGSGSLELREGPGPAVMVTETSSFSTVDPTSSVSGDVLTLDLPCGGGFLQRCEADWDLIVPPGTDVVVEHALGDVDLQGVTGAVEVNGSLGDVRVSGAPSTLDVRLSLGDVVADLDEPADRVSIQTNLGDVEVTLPGEVAYDLSTSSDVETPRTEVRTDPASPYRVDVRTDLGEIALLRG